MLFSRILSWVSWSSPASSPWKLCWRLFGASTASPVWLQKQVSSFGSFCFPCSLPWGPSCCTFALFLPLGHSKIWNENDDNDVVEMTNELTDMIWEMCHKTSFFCPQVTKKQTWQVPMLMGTLGSLCLLFFIMICFVSLEPFRCHLHPNGLATMQTSQSVFCDFSGEHLRLCIVGGLTLLFPLAFFALSTWIIAKELPRRVQKGDTDFVRTTSFLTMRFKPGQWIETKVDAFKVCRGFEVCHDE